MATATSPQTLLSEGACYQCFGALTEAQMLRFALQARALRALNPLAATDPQSLLEYARCMGCYGNLSLNEMMEMAMLDQIAQNSGGGSGGSCLICAATDPTVDSTCTCGLWINTTTGGVWYWSTNPPWNPGVPEWTELLAGTP